jgi:acetoin utilization deacetylase AcuC-like enzyme
VQVLLKEGAVQRVAIIDLDVHQGDGTAVCLKVWGSVRRRLLGFENERCGHYRLGRAPRRRNCCVLEGVGGSEE